MSFKETLRKPFIPWSRRQVERGVKTAEGTQSNKEEGRWNHCICPTFRHLRLRTSTGNEDRKQVCVRVIHLNYRGYFEYLNRENPIFRSESSSVRFRVVLCMRSMDGQKEVKEEGEFGIDMSSVLEIFNASVLFVSVVMSE